MHPDSGVSHCSKSNVLTVNSNGVQSWLRVWINLSDTTKPVMEYSDDAKALLGEHADPTFDNDYARWLASQPKNPCAVPGSDQCGSQ